MIGLVNVVRKLRSSFPSFYLPVSIHINNVGFVARFVKKIRMNRKIQTHTNFLLICNYDFIKQIFRIKVTIILPKYVDEGNLKQGMQLL